MVSKVIVYPTSVPDTETFYQLVLLFALVRVSSHFPLSSLDKLDIIVSFHSFK